MNNIIDIDIKHLKETELQYSIYVNSFLQACNISDHCMDLIARHA